MNNQRILVVEDEALIAENLRRILAGFGYQVVEPLSSGEAAIEYALQNPPDLLLMDIKLAGDIDGVEAAEQIKAHCDIPVIYMTAYSEEVYLKRAQRTEPYGYLVKPVQEPELYATLKLAFYKHQVDRQLRETEEKFRQVTENIREVFWLGSTANGKIIYASPAYEVLFGQSCEKLYQSEDAFLPSVHLEDRERFSAHYTALITENIPFDMECRIVRSDHSVRWVRMQAYPVRDATGHVYRYSGTSEDITERKTAEQEKDALIEISQLFMESHSLQEIYQVLPELLARQFSFPVAAIELFDAVSNETIFVGTAGFTPDKDFRRVPLAGSISGTVVETGRPLIVPDASAWPDPRHPKLQALNTMSIVCVPLRGQDAVLGVITLADSIIRHDLSRLSPTLQIVANHLSQEITRKWTEEALRNSEAKLQEAHDIARLGHWEFDILRQHLTCSDLIFDLFEVDPAEYQTSYDNFLSYIHPEDRELVHHAYQSSLINQTPYQITHRFLLKDGRVKWVNVIGRTEYDEQGNPIRSIGVIHEVTELHDAEEQQRELREMFFKAFHTSPDSININRIADGRYLSINEGFTQMTGYTAEDISGKSSLDISIWEHPADREQFIYLLSRFGEVNNMEASFRIQNGDLRYGLTSAKVIEINGEKCAISVTRDITERKQSEDLLRRTTEELQAAYDAIITGWSRALELRERETAGHSLRVSMFTLALANKLGILEKDIDNIQRGALLHDIGKMGIPDSILLKNGSLTEQEWTLMRKHPDFAYCLLSEMPFLSSAIDIPYRHHEWWNGNGYPGGLQGEQIPLSARIFAVVDVWDALMHDRPYRKAWSEEDVVRYIREQSGKQFDPHVVAVFLELLETGYYHDLVHETKSTCKRPVIKAQEL